MTRRSGVTLIEVLVAIFIMGIGLIALLTLFPLGILTMARAIRDDRAGMCGYNASMIADLQNVRDDLDARVAVNDFYNGGATNNDLFANPCPILAGNPFLPNADPYGESYPIFVDPVGADSVPTPDWVGNYPGVLRRRPAEFVRRTAANAAARALNIRQFFTLTDDFDYETTTNNPLALPATPQKIGPVILRSQRTMSWAYLLRRPQTNNRSIVDLSVVVYGNRPLALNGSQTLQEHVYPNMAFFNPNNNTIAIDFTSPTVVKPPVRAGDWILDATPYPTGPGMGSARAYFYRVVGVEEFFIPGPPARQVMRFEVQNPIRGINTNLPMTDAFFGYQGTAVFMEGVIEVFERGPTRMQ